MNILSEARKCVYVPYWVCIILIPLKQPSESYWVDTIICWTLLFFFRGVGREFFYHLGIPIMEPYL